MDTGIHELSAAYALDALTPEEREEFERHLDECSECRDEVASFRDVAGSLALAADGPTPSPDLRDRILAAARKEEQTVVPFESRRRRTAPILAAATAIAAAVAIGLGIWAISLHGQLSDSRDALAAQQDVASVLADPNATTVAMQQGSGRVVVGSDGAAVLVLDQLAEVPSGKTYQAWVVNGKTPVSAGTFAANDGAAVVPLSEQVSSGSVVAVTVEKDGGASSPTLPTVAASKPV